MYYRIGIGTKYYGDQRVFPAARVLVGDDGVEFSPAEGGLVYTQMRTDVLGEHTPSLRVSPLPRPLPVPITAQVALILTLKQIPVNIEKPFKRAARNRVSVQAYLLKKPRTLSRSGCLQPRCPSVWIRFCLSLSPPNACV